MGDCYKKLIAAEGGRLWDTYRNGLAHEYAIKKDSIVGMLKDGEDCGIGKTKDGRRYFLVVERYYEDFMRAAHQLYEELLENPVLPK